MPEPRNDEAAPRNPAEAITAGSGAYFEGARRMQSEYAAFMAERLEDDRKTLQDLAGCRQFADVVDVQQRWMARCSESWMRESAKLTVMAMDSFGLGGPRAGG